MGSQSKIEWTDASWNPVRARLFDSGGAGADDARALPAGESRTGWHCEHVSEGCRNCYAESINKRLGTGLDFKPGHRGGIEIFLDEKLLTDPLRWKRPRSVFLSSMTDVFADFVTDEMLDRLFAVMALCSASAWSGTALRTVPGQHFFRVLTKRTGRMEAYILSLVAGERDVGTRAMEIARDFGANEIEASRIRDAVSKLVLGKSLPNVGLGVSVEDQASADERIPHLLAAAAAMRFVSAEPLLGPVDLEPWLDWGDGDGVCNRDSWGCQGCDTDCGSCPNEKAVSIVRQGPDDSDGAPEWIAYDRVTLDEVIAGGESGAGARPMHPGWVRSLRDQCAAADTAFFFKQWGEWAPEPFGRATIEHVEGDRGGWVAAWPNGTLGNGSASDRGGCADRMVRVGKKAAGAMLDGREHRAVAPQVTAHFERLGRAA